MTHKIRPQVNDNLVPELNGRVEYSIRCRSVANLCSDEFTPPLPKAERAPEPVRKEVPLLLG
jgi:hypothetical protein